MNKETIEFLGTSKQHFNELVDSNIAILLNDLSGTKNYNKRIELIHMIDILRMTRKK